MITVTVYYRKNNLQCEQTLADLIDLQSIVPHQLVQVDIDLDEELKKAYDSQIPVVQAGPFHLQSPFTRQELLVALSAARDRHEDLKDDKRYQERLKKGHTVSTSDHISLWLSNHFMALFNTFLFLYVGLPFLAPALMKVGLTQPAEVIYAIYSPLCHQLAYRSFFLFGEQPYYPRAMANIPNIKTYEEVSGLDSYDTVAGRFFIGNPVLGYKVAICQRDVAIYGAFLLFGVVFSLIGRKWKPLQWYFWLLVGIIPMGLDGGSQLPSLIQGVFPAWFPIRESTPFLRVLTGVLFGLTTAWYLFPYVEVSMQDTHSLLLKKMAIVNKLLAEAKPDQETDAI